VHHSLVAVALELGRAKPGGHALQAAPPESRCLVRGKANWTSPWQVMIGCYSWSNETIENLHG